MNNETQLHEECLDTLHNACIGTIIDYRRLCFNASFESAKSCSRKFLTLRVC